MYSDIRNDRYYCRVDGLGYSFAGTLPFTLKEIAKGRCADKALVLKHADKAQVTNLHTLESIPRKYG